MQLLILIALFCSNTIQQIISFYKYERTLIAKSFLFSKIATAQKISGIRGLVEMNPGIIKIL